VEHVVTFVIYGMLVVSISLSMFNFFTF